jgi:hypothetical protein
MINFKNSIRSILIGIKLGLANVGIIFGTINIVLSLAFKFDFISFIWGLALLIGGILLLRHGKNLLKHSKNLNQ